MRPVLDKQVTVRVKQSTWQWLEAYAIEHELAVSDVIREAVLLFMAWHHEAHGSTTDPVDLDDGNSQQEPS